MAQVDTGLGWSAKDNYLISTIGTVANLMQVSGAVSVPYAPTNPDMLAGTYLQLGYNSETNREVWFGSKNIDIPVFAYRVDNIIRIFAFTSGASVHRALYNNNVQDIVSTNEYNLTNTTGNIYYRNETLSSGYTPNPIIPAYETHDAALAAITSDLLPFTKTNAGPAVVCNCRWKSDNGTLITSPILISSDTLFTDMIIADSSLSIAKLNIQYKGFSFYMAFYGIANGIIQSTMPLIDLTGLGPLSLNVVFQLIANPGYSNIEILESIDPYHEPAAEEGGGDGNDDNIDNVDFTDPPSTSIGASGFLTIFTPSLGQLQNLASFMWTSFDVDNWRRLFANPMDAILGLHIIPVSPSITGTKTVKVAGISTEIEMDYTTVRYIRRPMGTCDIPKKWGAYLDYNPYTKISIFLPYIGFRALDADDIMGQTISLQYIIDVLTGACVAELKNNTDVLYSWEGNCANQIPITGSDWRGAISTALGVAGSIAGMALTGGATAPMIAGTIASVGANSLNLKPNVERSGSISGSGGFMARQRPYIVRTVPNLVIPADQNKFIGYPSFVTTSLGSLTGYNEISSIHLVGIPATGAELDELESILRGGVIF